MRIAPSDKPRLVLRDGIWTCTIGNSLNDIGAVGVGDTIHEAWEDYLADRQECELMFAMGRAQMLTYGEPRTTTWLSRLFSIKAVA